METPESTQPPQPQSPETQSTCVTADPGRHRTGKIGRLPKSIRDRIHFMLIDGVSYKAILAAIGQPAEGITENNLSRFANGAHQEWLKQQQRLDEVRVKQEVAMDLATPEGGSRIHEATLQLAATNLTEVVRELDTSDFRALLRDEPAQLVPFLNTLARISDAELRCERHRLDLDRSAAAREQTAAKKGLTTTTRKQMETDLNLM